MTACRITVQAFDSDRFHQRLDYKLFNPSVDWDTIKPLWNRTAPIQELNIQSVITAPRKPSPPPGKAIQSHTHLTARLEVLPLAPGCSGRPKPRRGAVHRARLRDRRRRPPHRARRPEL